MHFVYTINSDNSPRNYGKNPSATAGDTWQTVTGDIQSLVTHNYVNGRAFAAGTFDHDAALIVDPADPKKSEKTHKINRLWRGAQLVVLDVDDAPEWDMARLISDPFVQRHAAAVIPSSSYTPDKLKAHVLFVLDHVVTEQEIYTEVGLGIVGNSQFPNDPATLRHAQAVYGTVFTADSMKAHVRSIDDCIVWVNPNAEPIHVHALMAERIASGALKPVASDARGGAFRADGEITRRLENHFKASSESQTSVVIEALEYALTPTWGELPRDKRLPLIMSAFAGSNDTRVRDTFLEYSSPAWDVSTQRETLETWWQSHTPRVGGITVELLFRVAQRQGWLTGSSVELTGYAEIYSEEVSDWLLTTALTPRILLKSGTGTGKTKAAIALLKRMDGAKAVFFAPSIKLCQNLHATLEQAGIKSTLYLDTNRKTKDAKTLIGANVLVTTLQTFAVKAFNNGVDMASYDLVVMDESDELFSGFVKSGIGGKLSAPSHVDKTQARLGVDALSEIFVKSKQVLLLDGTATELSRFVMEKLSPAGSTAVYLNTFKRDKAPVTLYASLDTLREDIVAQARAGKRIVIACDTKSEAALTETIIKLCDGATREEVIRITGDTVADQRVSAFFSDVEKGASEYRVVLYNSAMGSGVSITQTTPDVMYLISTYLAPRKLIQMLNRYRSQTEVKCYIAPRESLYSTTVEQRYEQMQNVITVEQALSGLDKESRSSLSEVVSQAGLIVATDEFDQFRSVKTFFEHLLHEDGRRTSKVWDGTSEMEATVKFARGLLKDAKQEVRDKWRSVTPIRRGEAFPKGITVEESACGLLHGLIAESFTDYSQGALGLSDADIAELALTFNRKRGILRHWLNPDRIINTTVEEMTNSRKQNIAFKLYFSRVEIVSLLNILWPDINTAYTDEELGLRAKSFIHEVEQRKATYNMVAPNNYSTDALEGEGGVDLALKYAKALAKSLGLSLKRRNGKRVVVDGVETRERITGIVNLDKVLQYATLSGIAFDRDGVRDFNRSKFADAAKEARKASSRFNGLRESEKREVLGTLNLVDGIDFGLSVEAVSGTSFLI